MSATEVLYGAGGFIPFLRRSILLVMRHIKFLVSEVVLLFRFEDGLESGLDIVTSACIQAYRNVLLIRHL